MEKYSDRLRYYADLLDEDFSKHIRKVAVLLAEMVMDILRYELKYNKE